MKLIHFLFVFVILNCVSIRPLPVSNEDDFILTRIISGTNNCISKDIYSHESLAQCRMAVTNESAKYANALSILCVSLYDSLLRLCEEKKQNVKLGEKIPQDLKHFSKLVDSQTHQDADAFCTEARSSGNLMSVDKPLNNETGSFINRFASSLKKDKSCFWMCSAGGESTLEPLCPLIVWVNQLTNRNAASVPEQSTVIKNDGVPKHNDTSSRSGDTTAVGGNVKNGGTKPKAENQPANEVGETELVHPNVKNAVPHVNNPAPSANGGESVGTSKNTGDSGGAASLEQVLGVAAPATNKGEDVSHGSTDAGAAALSGKDVKQKGLEGETENAALKEEGEKDNEQSPVVDDMKQQTDKTTKPVIVMEISKQVGEPVELKKNKETETTKQVGEPVELKKNTDSKAEVSQLGNSGVVAGADNTNSAPAVTPTQVDLHADNKDNTDRVNNDNGGNVISNEEDNDGNGDFGGLDENGPGEEESDDVQIPSSVKETPQVPAQNKQETANEPAVHAGMDEIAKTDVEVVIVHGRPMEPEDSHFYTYFVMMAVLSIIVYLVFHNKKKLVALAVEGRRTRTTSRRRPNTASYSKLDCNLEEAMVSNTTASVTHVLY